MVNFDYLFDKRLFEKETSFNHLVDKKLSFKTFDGAYVLPIKVLPNQKTGGGVVLKNGEFLLFLKKLQKLFRR